MNRLLEMYVYGQCPPSWLRHFIPWRVIDRIEVRLGLCRCGIVMWKLGYEWTWDRPTETCFNHERGVPCWCGRYESAESVGLQP